MFLRLFYVLISVIQVVLWTFLYRDEIVKRTRFGRLTAGALMFLLPLGVALNLFEAFSRHPRGSCERNNDGTDA